MKIQKIKLQRKPIYVPSSDNEDVFELFLQIEQAYDNCYIFESLGEAGEMARYTILGFDPEYIVSGNGTTLTVNNQKYIVENPYKALSELIPQDCFAYNYAGGLVGYLGYNAVNCFEPSLHIKPHPLFDQFLFGIYTDGVIFDKVTGQLTYFYYNKNRLPEILKIPKTKIHKKKVSISSITQNTTQKEHAAMVAKVKSEILAGNTFQTVVGLQSEFTVAGDAVELYQRLRSVNPSPFMYYVKFGPTEASGSKKVIIGASPELLFGMRNKEMTTFPLAGTIKRGKTQREDQELARQLLNNPKEIAEHKMLVDLHRNDIGRVAAFGSVKVRNYLNVKRFSHVQHIASEVVGLLGKGEDMFSAVASNFPAGTLTGAPKIESMKIIERLEKAPRGPYGGALGHFGFNGDCTFAIPIRTLFINGTYGFTQAGSGIVADSSPEGEFDEIQRKMAAIREVLSTI